MFQSKEASFQIKLGLMKELKYCKNLQGMFFTLFFTTLKQGRRRIFNDKQQYNNT